MSRAQGDHFRTETNYELNAYRARLDAKLSALRDRKEKWYRIDGFHIHTESENTLENPNGPWKWNGWEVKDRLYWIRVYEEGSSVAILTQSFTDRDEANEFFRMLIH